MAEVDFVFSGDAIQAFVEFIGGAIVGFVRGIFAAFGPFGRNSQRFADRLRCAFAGGEAPDSGIDVSRFFHGALAAAGSTQVGMAPVPLDCKIWPEFPAAPAI